MPKKLLLLVGAVLILGLAWGGWRYIRNRGQNGEGTAIPGGEESTVGSPECPIGGYWSAGGIEYRITGYESHTLGGSSRRLCCGTWEDTGEDQKMKYCYDVNAGDYHIAWVANTETGGKYAKSMESYQQGEQTCFRLFDAQERPVAESCQ